MCACVCVRVCVCPVHSSMGAPVDVCECMCVCGKEKGVYPGAHLSFYESGKRVGEGQGDGDPGRNGPRPPLP
jgi:hypothetical protein